MIERVAKAMQLETVNKPFSWESAARAAIEAMREPTPKMVHAMATLINFCENLNMGESPSPWDAYATMIDAALEDAK